MRGEAELLGPAEIRALADRLGARPTKKFGQNFVHDANTVRRIVAGAELRPDDVVLEVGPGLGSLTLGLLPEVATVHAVEVDPVLGAELPCTVGRRAPDVSGRLSVHVEDALRACARGWQPPPTTLVANLPYNVAVPVVLRLLGQLDTLRGGLVMVQSEVADRLTAAPGSRVYGAPSVKLAWYASARRAGVVPRSVFWPVPNVDSALVSFARRSPPEYGAREQVFALVDAAFAQRRKTLRAALAGVFGGTGQAAEALDAADVVPTLRAEQLTVSDFARIAAVGKSPHNHQ